MFLLKAKVGLVCTTMFTIMSLEMWVAGIAALFLHEFTVYNFLVPYGILVFFWWLSYWPLVLKQINKDIEEGYIDITEYDDE